MQTAFATSSGEAEYYASCSTAADILYLQQLMEFLGLSLRGVLFTDSSASLGMASRQGVGQVRSLDTKLLWLQDKIKQNVLTIRKVAGGNNVADIGTKVLPAKTLTRLATLAGIVRFSDGIITRLAS